MHTIVYRDSILRVTITGAADAAVFRDAIAEELNRPEYAASNDIWILSGCQVMVALDDLATIAGWLAQCYPAHATRTRTAIVADSGLTRAMANIWREAARDLPYEMQVFEDLAAARLWVG